MLMKSKLTETDLSAVVKASRESRQSTENVDCSSKLSPQNRYRVPRVRSNWRHLGIMLNKMKKKKSISLMNGKWRELFPIGYMERKNESLIMSAVGFNSRSHLHLLSFPSAGSSDIRNWNGRIIWESIGTLSITPSKFKNFELVSQPRPVIYFHEITRNRKRKWNQLNQN